MSLEIKNGKLIITLKLKAPTISSSGKSLLIASSRGVRISKSKFKGKPIRFIANAFIELTKGLDLRIKDKKESKGTKRTKRRRVMVREAPFAQD